MVELFINLKLSEKQVNIDLRAALTDEEAREILQLSIEDFWRFSDLGFMRRSAFLREYPPCKTRFLSIIDTLDLSLHISMQKEIEVGAVTEAHLGDVLDELIWLIEEGPLKIYSLTTSSQVLRLDSVKQLAQGHTRIGAYRLARDLERLLASIAIWSAYCDTTAISSGSVAQVPLGIHLANPV